MKFSSIFYSILVLFLISACSINVGSQTTYPLEEKVVEGKGDNKILVIDISGVIGEQQKEPLFTTQTTRPSGIALIKEQLQYAKERSDIKAILLRIDSPGGEVTKTDIIYHELLKFKEQTQKPIIAVILSVGASGAYYLSMAADKIIAHPTSMVGSIGVILLHFNAGGLLEKIGVKEDTITAGKFKNMGSPTRAMSEDERQIFQNLLDATHQRFKEIIQKGRTLPSEKVDQFADGRIFTAKQALDYQMIDQIGYLDDAIQQTKEAAKIKDAQIIILKRPGDYKASIYSQFDGSPMKINLVNFDFGSILKGQSPSIMYLWM